MHYEKWKTLAPLGLATVGLGVSIVGQAIIQKGRGGSTLGWVLSGTLGLVALNAGLSMFGDAVKHRALYEIKEDTHETPS